MVKQIRLPAVCEQGTEDAESCLPVWFAVGRMTLLGCGMKGELCDLLLYLRGCQFLLVLLLCCLSLPVLDLDFL